MWEDEGEKKNTKSINKNHKCQIKDQHILVV